VTKRSLPPRLSQPLKLRAEDQAWPAKPTILSGQRDDHLDVPRVLDEMRDRFGLLWKHYSIDPNDPDAWKALAVALAFDHVPGFRVTKPGRSKVGTDYVSLFDEVRRASKRRAPSDAEIAYKVAKQHGGNGSTILRRYQEQKAAKRTSSEAERQLIAAMAARTILGK
jgi:hypothetical protein